MLTIPSASNVSALRDELAGATGCPWLAASESDTLSGVEPCAEAGDVNDTRYTTVKMISRGSCSTNGVEVFNNPTKAFLFSPERRKEEYGDSILGSAVYLPGNVISGYMLVLY